MIELARTIRFCLDPGAPRPAKRNTFAAWPPVTGLGNYLEAEVVCEGEPDPVTGYFMNIKHIDEAFRNHGLPVLEAATAAGPGRAPVGPILRRVIEAIRGPLDESVVRLELRLSPYHRIQMKADAMNELCLRQQYEFSAAHRLHVPELSDEKNREIFGKCNNPSGHGHNYRLEVAVRVPVDDAGRALEAGDLDAVVDDEVIERLDHKHLNRDVAAFANLNPSVENIAIVIWNMLEKPVQSLEAELEEVRVWETGKTVCAYRGE